MIGFLKKKHAPILGLDISSTAVKLLELSENSGQYRVESYGVVPLPASAVTENNINEVNSVSEAVSKVVAKSKSKSKNAAVAVSGSAVITKVVEMQGGLTDEQLELQVSNDAEQYIPFPIEEVALDFDVQGPAGGKGDKVEVLIAACRRENIETRVASLGGAGINTKIVDVQAFSMERAFELIKPQLDGDADSMTAAIVDVGSRVTSLNVIQECKTVYSREQIFGGQQLTEEIQRRYGLSHEEAGIAKKQGGLPDDYEQEVLAPFLDAVVQQITRSLQFYFSSSEHEEVDYVILAGGVASMEGLAELVQDRLGTPCIVANPFSNMSVSSKVNAMALSNDAPALMVACGLSMRGIV